MFSRWVGVPEQILWSVDGGFLPPQHLWEDAQGGSEQQERIYFWVDDAKCAWGCRGRQGSPRRAGRLGDAGEAIFLCGRGLTG